MKYLKTINELFDNDDLKSQFEIPYLTGEISPKTISNWKPLKEHMDPQMTQIANDCPYLVEFKYRRSGSVLSIGFDKTIKHDENNSVFYYFLIEIVKFRKEYSLNVYAKCYGNGKQIYNESIIKKTMPYNDMINLLKKTVFNMIIDFNNFINRMFGESHFSISDKDTLIFNPSMN